jgi:hypothetical protein
MHSTARNRATVGPSGPKAVLADKHAHDLDEDIRVSFCRVHSLLFASRHAYTHNTCFTYIFPAS